MATKCVKVCRNGDGFFPPVNVVVNPRDIRSMDAFLDRVTQATRMRNAVRKVCTPRKGHRIQDLTKLISGETYVAVGQEGFKYLEYGNIHLRRPVLQRREIKIEPVKHSRIVISARCRKVALWESAGLKTIHVYRNGDDKHPSHKILLDRRTLLNMDKVLEQVTERVKLESGAVFGLYTLHGKEVCTTSELVNGDKYVAVGHGKRFKKTAYNDNHNVSPGNSPRRTKVKYKVMVKRKTDLTPANTEIRKEKIFLEKSSGNEIQGRSIAPTRVQAPARTIQPMENNPSRADNPTQQNAYKKHQGKSKEEKIVDNIEDDRPHDHIYKASGTERENAKQVDDDQEIKVEKPIDQVPAEEVGEETVEQDGPENLASNEKRPKQQDQVKSPTSGSGHEDSSVSQEKDKK